MTTSDEASELEKKFPVGSVAYVYYDPEAPNEAVLIKGPPRDGKIYGGVILSTAAILVGLGVSFAAYLGVMS